ncbi:serine/threonine-protein kinase [Arcobacter sp. CECT 8986]|uniref:serine/threonine-protein kinase n=1 Tax=Arcobacter sp. CECT 8986 TaxID=2044507 RepID=UPI0013E97BF4|nr:serine/threonine-protein kinase [Arcobacter sp. CECT 8986]
MKELLKQIKKDSKVLNENEKVTILNKRYILKQLVGTGGLCDVYKADDIYDLHFNKESKIVAKIPNENLKSYKDIDSLLYSEYTFLKKLNHKNIVKVLDFGIDKKSNMPYIILEYIEGKLLKDIPFFEMSNKFKLNILKTLVSLVEYIHSNNIIHADINPSNIIIDKNNNLTLIDFGISKSINTQENIELDYTKVKAYNPKYCAPELLDNQLPSIQSDNFSVASICFEIFTTNCIEKANEKIILNNFEKIPFLLKKWFRDNLSYKKYDRTVNKSDIYNKIVKFFYFN